MTVPFRPKFTVKPRIPTGRLVKPDLPTFNETPGSTRIGRITFRGMKVNVGAR